jgi:hypothetical protein
VGLENRQGIETIKGELVGIEGNNHVVQKLYGKEVWLISDAALRSPSASFPEKH